METLSSLLIGILFSAILTYLDRSIIIGIAEVSLHSAKIKKIKNSDTITKKVFLSSYRKYVPMFFFVWYYFWGFSRIVCFIVLLIFFFSQSYKVNSDVFMLYFAIQILPTTIIFGPGRPGTYERRKKCLKKFAKKEYKHRDK